MAVRLLIVDDSEFFRRRLTEIFAADARLEVVGVAGNGMEAVAQVERLKPDIVTMDVEMPVMDGIVAVQRIMEKRPIPILMLSSLTTKGAQATLDALDAGAMDFMPKRFEDISSDVEQAKQLLCTRAVLLGRCAGRMMLSSRSARLTAGAAPVLRPAPPTRFTSTGEGRLRNRCNLVAIGASTGGPSALQQILSELPADFPLPIVVAQHMPAAFTGHFAQRMDKQCKIKVKEAAEGDVLTPAHVYIAPGGCQMRVEDRDGKMVIRVTDAEPGQNYHPSVDITFSSVAQACGNRVLALMLTGMGTDGRDGTRLLKNQGAIVWAQDEQSCVVYGMPAAVVQAGLADQVLPLAQIGTHLTMEV